MNADTSIPDIEECCQFLQLWMEVTGAPHITLTSIVPDGKTTTSTFGHDGLDAAAIWVAAGQADGRNLYFQPNETMPACDKKPAKLDMMAALCRFADIDPLDDQFSLAEERERLAGLAAQLVADPSHPPTVIIDSGNGVQPIWAVVREVLSPKGIARIEKETKAIEDALGAGGTHNIDRLLRLPGTVNFPNAKKRDLGRGVSRARLIFKAPNLYTIEQAAGLAPHLTAMLADRGLVRPKSARPDKGPAVGASDDAATALVAALEAAGADKITRTDQLPANLQARLSAALAARKWLADRWAGLVDDLAEAGRDASRSGVDLSLAAMLKFAGFAHLDTGLLLCAFKHGKANNDEWSSATIRLRHVARCVLRSHEPSGVGSTTGEPQDEVPDEDRPPAFTDEALALRFADEHKDRLRYVAAWGKWLIRRPAVWRFDDTMRAFDLARAICRKAAAECNKPKLAAAVASAETVAAVERLAKADRRHAATVDQWDADPWLLNTPGGVVDLRTGKVREHTAADYMTKIAAVAPGGECPLWQMFLSRITASSTELQAFLQRVAGYALTGSTKEHALFFGYGTGSNGKGVFLNTLAGIMGGYAAVAMMETFTASQGERHPTDLAMLRGARLVTAQETEEGRRWAESRIKALTGGDPITARFMRQDFFTFTPQFKLFIAGNHKPGLRNVNEAIRRRFNLIPFEVKIPAAERDPDLAEKLKTEWPGILQWMIDGCLAWQAKRLAPPQAVTRATDDYLEAEDALGQWIAECCDVQQFLWARSSELFASWREWAERAGEYAGSRKRFSQALEARGFRPKRQPGTGRTGFEGLAPVRGLTPAGAGEKPTG